MNLVKVLLALLLLCGSVVGGVGVYLLVQEKYIKNDAVKRMTQKSKPSLYTSGKIIFVSREKVVVRDDYRDIEIFTSEKTYAFLRTQPGARTWAPTTPTVEDLEKNVTIAYNDDGKHAIIIND